MGVQGATCRTDAVSWEPYVKVARIAQSVEHILGKDEVIGSIPIACFENGRV